MLVGRTLECERIDSLLDMARSGSSGALVIRGEPGVGKTALLGHAAELGSDMRVLRAQGVEVEQGLPYAGLSLLLSADVGLLDHIPSTQRRALASALQVGAAGPVDRFAVYAGTLSLLACVAEAGPLLVLVDDVHWLDVESAQALVFAARRLGGEGISMVLALREREPAGIRAEGLPELALAGLGVRDARALLQALTGHDVPVAVGRRLHEATAGNPLGLRELARGLTGRQLAGVEPLADPLPGGARLDAAFGRRIDALPADARRALVVAAADDAATLGQLGRALEALGLAPTALDSAEAAGLVTLHPARVEFGHPLVRSTAYHRAPAPERRAVHRALADALDGPDHRARRAHHLAAATLAPDEAVATELQAAAGEARMRGAPAAAARALEAAASVTPAGRDRAERLLHAAQARQIAGQPETVTALLDEALAAAVGDAVLRARIQQTRGRAEFLCGAPRAAQALLRAEAERVRPVDDAQATAMLVEACFLSATAGEPSGLLEAISEVVPAAEALGGPVALTARWLLGAAHVLAGDLAEGRRLLQMTEPALDAQPFAVPMLAGVHGLCLLGLEQHERAHAYLTRLGDRARQEGAVEALPHILATLADAEFCLGRWVSSYALASQAATLAEDFGQMTELSYGLMGLTQVEAGRGRGDGARRHGQRSLEIARRFGVDSIVAMTGAALGLLELGLGQHRAAVERLEPAGQLCLDRGLENPRLVPWAQDLVEAHIHLGDSTRAEGVLVVLEGQAERSGGLIARAAAHRCRGLLASDDEFERHFRTALAQYGQRPAPFEEARTRLCFGERLRRARRRTEAREQLRGALETFVALGAQPWADRALRELRATGERARRRAPDTADQLTAQELQVALLAAEGATNREVAAALFVSPKTVETHLTHAYRKLGVRSRVELSHRLSRESTTHELRPRVAPT